MVVSDTISEYRAALGDTETVKLRTRECRWSAYPAASGAKLLVP